MTRLGVFGSSFNPPTLAHAVLLAEAGWQLALDRIMVVPTGEAWHKDISGAPAAGVRMALAKAAFGGQEGLEVSSLEVDRQGPSYTCDTLEEIHSLNPDSQIFFLSGSDAALGLGEWHRPDRVLELAEFAVAPRSEIARDAVAEVFERLGARDRLEFFAMPRMEFSSTLVRERIASNRPWKHLVPQGVAEMIDNEDLYGSKQ
ncbi:MAG TPA: nicotinate (nicotinamide) nucleotide adenylyltransferase [Solirubrobacterales bacterium]|nr:nicotinate (nicotinamide) nucleotide adenylyltransferase [Solirubrobacterales bacterium]HNF84096.1 nicotinate (nicotinamide) nucleotide adenylyltransferase [Solirubrobacterales bacterium]HNG56410.1 nicotinate (nicotinamide) nucleotide adenylyltransferase [Solirubrobacterales bacterium]